MLCLRSRADFKSKKIRVNLNQPIKAEVKAESSEVLKTVDEDRKYVIQATIVRCALSSLLRGARVLSKSSHSIMKARKTMKNQPLIQEVISQISQRFAPKIPDIKKVRFTCCSHSDLFLELTRTRCLPTGDRYVAGEGVHRACGRHKGHVRLCCIDSTSTRMAFE
jgi:hypothetical protein